ncbi:ABC-type transport system, involved in lipopr otein release, permease component MacB (plasmid) [Peptoclostridium acidaminophilum DSM 3953]|uniref:ABC-type transport system, involved in lipopr otein release, permease component MacB n=1 Tax=Peptoclostridium acidaminophilum DSM 3953 TaxID=1286171 RepID=W8TJJ8_PEPAC|nr:ABC transporter permease [Peptoclostridium acidaminophilum]AHM57963.1 ABC-type transport system, involved in lipopr otein release, permease component MacB [Peptoclostridium acidaminophilum DSM 3953]
MRISEILRSVLINIFQNKTRVILTTLGIIVGCATIILVIGIGNQSKQDVADRFKELNAQCVTISSSRNSTTSLTLDDVEFLKKYSEESLGITLSNSSSGTAAYKSESTTAMVRGVYDDYFSINNLTIESGRLLSSLDINDKEKNVVIGNDVATELFTTESALGSDILINGTKFTIVGILERNGSDNVDLGLYIPYDVVKFYLGGSSASNQITALAISTDEVSELQTEMKGLLSMKYDSDSFQIRDVGTILEAAQDSANTIALLLASIGAIVLVVGGIGIMNVLFVSVRERTKEIGTLKALGATKRDILLQFLFESLIISFIGGVIGSLATLLIAPVLKVFEMELLLDASAYIRAMAFSLITGTLFGYYPALQAAQLDTIDALRYE